MASRSLNPAYRLTTVREFLAMDLGDAKAELVDGNILMRAGGSPRHAAVAANLIAALGTRLRGSGCRPYGSDLAVRTGEASIRFSDVSVHCHDSDAPPPGDAQLLGDPRVVIEVLSPSTSSNDQITKLAEYRALPGVAEVVFVDHEDGRLRVIDCRRPDTHDAAWLPVGSDLTLTSLGIIIPSAEIFS